MPLMYESWYFFQYLLNLFGRVCSNNEPYRVCVALVHVFYYNFFKVDFLVLYVLMTPPT